MKPARGARVKVKGPVWSDADCEEMRWLDLVLTTRRVGWSVVVDRLLVLDLPVDQYDTAIDRLYEHWC
jgi:hypothetical protein